MSRLHNTPVNLPAAAADIVSPTLRAGDTYFNTTTLEMRVYTGSVWRHIQDRRVTSIASSATPTPNSDTSDGYSITALAAAATFGAPTGTPVDMQGLIIKIKDNGTARVLAWNAAYVARGVALPLTTVISKWLYVGLIWNATTSTWDCIAASQEA